jgi:hypothetical protein
VSDNPYTAPPNPPVRVYDVRHAGDFMRAIVTRDGSLSILSSFTNCGIWWSGRSPGDIRDFLIHIGADYVQESLLHKRHDSRACKREIRGMIKKMWPLLVERLAADLAADPDWKDAPCTTGG